MADDIGEAELHQRVAAQCNNAAWDLLEKPDLNVTELVELVRLAATARSHWSESGTPGNIAHADLLFGWALARAGASAIAGDRARHAFDYFRQTEAEDWELAFVHAAMAAVCFSAGDTSQHMHHYAEAERLVPKLAPSDLDYFQKVFRTVPKP